MGIKLPKGWGTRVFVYHPNKTYSMWVLDDGEWTWKSIHDYPENNRYGNNGMRKVIGWDKKTVEPTLQISY